jgi:hypothetical protein
MAPPAPISSSSNGTGTAPNRSLIHHRRPAKGGSAPGEATKSPSPGKVHLRAKHGRRSALGSALYRHLLCVSHSDRRDRARGRDRAPRPDAPGRIALSSSGQGGDRACGGAQPLCRGEPSLPDASSTPCLVPTDSFPKSFRARSTPVLGFIVAVSVDPGDATPSSARSLSKDALHRPSSQCLRRADQMAGRAARNSN